MKRDVFDVASPFVYPFLKKLVLKSNDVNKLNGDGMQ